MTDRQMDGRTTFVNLELLLRLKIFIYNARDATTSKNVLHVIMNDYVYVNEPAPHVYLMGK